MGEISIPLLSLKPNGRTTQLIAIVVLLLAGGSVTFLSACTYAKGKSALRWQPVRGDLITLAWHSPSEGADYPTVHYQYAFAGKSYEGSQACFGAASEATCKLRAASAGEKITVFVNPANPSESVLFAHLLSSA